MSDVKEIFETMSYGPALEQADYVHDWLSQHSKGFELFIDGEWCQPLTSSTMITTCNPANGQALGKITAAGEDDVEAAVAGPLSATADATSSRDNPRRFLGTGGAQAGRRSFATGRELDTG